ncbi:MAG TPA: polyketide synthase, partial [Flavobacteriaceae bacterium]|nr:polyketide synthase [Flavobacteriaceae bacterium]
HFNPISKNEQDREIELQIQKHIEGVLVGPITVYLGMDGMFHKYFMEASFSADEFHEDPVSFSKILDFFTFLGWFNKKNEHYRFTDKGLFFARRSSAYGVTVSYLPTFRRVDELLFGNASIFKSNDPSATEMHVDREMNVWGSGGAHSAYFKKIDEIVIALFNKPIEEQPKGILDMGCGNGAFLIHLFEVIEQRTKRGTMLEEYPLFLVGVDYNRAALKVTRA